MEIAFASKYSRFLCILAIVRVFECMLAFLLTLLELPCPLPSLISLSLRLLDVNSRASLEPRSGRLSAFAKPNEASAILATLEETEEWLYGADQIKDKVRRSSLPIMEVV